MTCTQYARTAILIGFAVPGLYADFTYESTSRITGGALVGMMKFAGAFSKDARKMMDPIPSTTAIKGNRMVHRSADSASIIDLDKETITHIDYARKTYSVVTFAQMKQAMEDMAQKMQQQKSSSGTAPGATPGTTTGTPPPDMQFDIKMNDTGQTKSINGMNAHELIMTMTMQGTDTKSGAKGGIDVTTDMWIAPKVAGYDEVRDFNRRMGQKIAWSPDANPFINRPDMRRAMTEMSKEGSKLDGMPVYETIKMGGKLEGVPDTSSSSQSQASRNSTPPPASVSDALGAALGARLGMGGFGRRKKEAPADSGSNNSNTGSNSGDPGSNSASGSLMEMTMEVTNYSSAPASTELFEVPSGFSQVQEDPMRGNRRQR